MPAPRLERALCARSLRGLRGATFPVDAMETRCSRRMEVPCPRRVEFFADYLFIDVRPFIAVAARPMMRMRRLFSYISLVLASNYLAFQIELFDREYEAAHPPHYGSLSLTRPTLTWETFDKANAPKAFVVRLEMVVESFFLLPDARVPADPTPRPFQPVRDKSPPLSPAA